jgi:Ser/Thr protein kinase RdoA (MazF antagonist)
MLAPILAHWNIEAAGADVAELSGGLINRTWRLMDAGGRRFILQKINHAIFQNPQAIDDNLRLLAGYLERHHPDFLFTAPVAGAGNRSLLHYQGGYYRLFPFIPGSHTFAVAERPAQAFEAARQFGRFTKILSRFNAADLKTTLPHFHDLPLRYEQFEAALTLRQNPARLEKAVVEISFLQNCYFIVTTFEHITHNAGFKMRVTHHDTKISNVLFDKAGEGLCVIDLDTVMPGYFISDVGDMMRTYLCPVSEEESDFDKIVIRDDFYKAIADGYLSEMGNELTTIERQYFYFSGQMMVYMQALRFITDFLNNDMYYGARYETHNLVRGGNQCRLLQQLLEKTDMLRTYVS